MKGLRTYKGVGNHLCCPKGWGREYIFSGKIILKRWHACCNSVTDIYSLLCFVLLCFVSGHRLFILPFHMLMVSSVVFEFWSIWFLHVYFKGHSRLKMIVIQDLFRTMTSPTLSSPLLSWVLSYNSFMLFELSRTMLFGLPWWLGGKEFACPARAAGDSVRSLWVWKISWMRAWPPNPVFLSGESHGQRNQKEGSLGSQLDMTEAT